MKFNGYSFPHPVLGLNDDIAGSVEVSESSIDDTTDPKNFILNIGYSLDNTDLLSLLINKKATFLCEADCTSTMYRQSFLSSDVKQSFFIPKDWVREKVELSFLMVASCDIDEYKNASAHKDFSGFSFPIQNGDVLAYMGKSSFNAEINYRKLKAVSSFLEIVKSNDEHGPMKVILDNPKIQVQLAKEDFDFYAQPNISKNPNYASTFHSSIVLPALIHALYQITLGLNKDDLKEKSWAKIIEFRIENEPELKDTQLNEENVFKISQIILGMPVDRLLKDLFQTITQTNQGE